MYNDYVSYKIAKTLNNTYYFEGKYAAGDVVVTWDNYLGTKKYREGDIIDDGDNIHGDWYFAPTYSELIDYLFDVHKVVVELNPAFTYSLNNHIAYYIKAYKINEEEAKLDCIFENEMEMYSFRLAFETIIDKIFEDGTEEG